MSFFNRFGLSPSFNNRVNSPFQEIFTLLDLKDRHLFLRTCSRPFSRTFSLTIFLELRSRKEERLLSLDKTLISTDLSISNLKS